MTQFRLAALALLVAGVVLASQPAQAVTYTAAPAVVAPGDSYDPTASLSGLGAAQLGAFDLDFGYDPHLLSFTGVTFGGLLGDPASLEALTSVTQPDGSSVDIAEVSLLTASDLAALQTGAALPLATLSFDALGSGVASLHLLNQVATDANGVLLPEPAGAAVLTSALGMLGLVLRRRPRQAR